jgi:hypothetical protein
MLSSFFVYRAEEFRLSVDALQHSLSLSNDVYWHYKIVVISAKTNCGDRAHHGK